MIHGIFYDFDFGRIFLKETYFIGFKKNEFLIIFLSIFFLLAAEILHKRRSLIHRLNNKGIFFRWGFYMTAIFAIIIFGVYGEGQIKEFIYFQF